MGGEADNAPVADAPGSDEAPAAADCSLGRREQTRNLLLFGVNTGLCYLASPVLYVGVVHASLCDRLGATATVSNLPATAYLAMSPMPLLVAWLFPFAHLLKRVMVACYASLAISSAMVAAVLMLPIATELQLAVLVLHGGIVGSARTVAVAFEFEVLGRGVSVSRRGAALGLGYGAGPILAIVGNLATQLILTGTLVPLDLPRMVSAQAFAVLFEISVPIMALATFLSSCYVVPAASAESPRLPFMRGVFGGFGKFLGQPVIAVSMIVSILILAGYTIVSNLNLYTREILGEAPAQFAGIQNTIRFACKAATGLFLGWMLTRTHPKAGVLLTAAAGLCAVLWATVAPGKWFLLSFGLLGAGELFGIYITNYILCCSPPSEVRRYMAFTMVTLFPAAFAGILFGGISDHWMNRAYPPIVASVVGLGAPPLEAPMITTSGWLGGTTRNPALAYGFQVSFVAAAAFIGLGILLTLSLPSGPRPREAQEEPVATAIGRQRT